MHDNAPIDGSAAKSAFLAFKDHFSDTRASTDFSFLESLRHAYPQWHVTHTYTQICNLTGYAEAGHAVSKLDESQGQFHTIRNYGSTGKRLDASSGTISENVSYALYSYTWEQHEFLVYRIKYSLPTGGCADYSFILKPLATDASLTADQIETQARLSSNATTDALILACSKWTADIHDEIYIFDSGYWNKSSELWKSVSTATWDDVVLDPRMKDNIRDDVLGFFDSQAIYEELTVDWKRGLILHGLPGNGKTATLKVLVSLLAQREEPIPSLYVKTLKAPGQHTSEQRSIRTIFDHARNMAPCMLIFEDLDSLVTDEVRSYFLNEVDGLQANTGILMVGSTNHLEKLDSSISRRPSRFDRKYHYKLPAEQQREMYCQYWKKKVSKSKRVDFPDELCGILAKMTEGFSYAYMKELFIMTLLSIARGKTGDEEDDDENEHDIRISQGKSQIKDDSMDIDTSSSIQNVEPKATSAASTTTGSNNPSDTSPNEASAAGTHIIPAPTAQWVFTKPKAKGDGVETEDIPNLRRANPNPPIDIPESLANNTLLKVARHQIKVLIEEMDNTTPDDWPSSKKYSSSVGSSVARREMMLKQQLRMQAGISPSNVGTMYVM